MPDAPRVAVIGLPGAWSSECLADNVAARTGVRVLIDPRGLRFESASGSVFHGDLDLTSLDGIIIKKLGSPYSTDYYNRLDLLRVVEQRGVRVFSSTSCIRRLVDRLSCTLRLREKQIPMPETIATESTEDGIAAVRHFGEAVLKPLFSTKAEGMALLDQGFSDEQLRKVFCAHQKAHGPMLYLQRRLPTIERDLGLVFLSGRYLGGYARVRAEGSWNTTIRSGGRYESCDASDDLIELGRRAQAVFGPDFTTVDIVETPGGPLVFEVSAFGGFRGLLEGAGIDAGAAYTEFVLRELRT